MKRLFFAVSLGLVLCRPGFGALPLWQNFGFTNKAPTIDALAMDNRGEIVLTNTSQTVFTINDPYQLSSYVFDTQNTRFFTNRGVMVGTLGFEFDTVKSANFGMVRVPAEVFTNSGTIAGVDDGSAYASGIFYAGILGYGTMPNYSSYVGISATNVGNTGLISVGDSGYMQISGKNVDLSLGALSAGILASDQTNFDSGNLFSYNFFYNNTGRGYLAGTNGYVNPTSVQDIYWAVDTNSLSLFTLNGGTPDGWTPYDPFSVMTNTSLFQAWAYTNIGVSNTYINIVFVRTNNTADNFIADVRFTHSIYTSFNSITNYDQQATEAIVRIGAVGKDVVTGIYNTNSFYVLDSGMQQNTIQLYTNLLTSVVVPTERPSCFEVTTTVPFEWMASFPANATYTPEMISPGLVAGSPYLTDPVTGPEALYGAQIGQNTSTVNGLNSLYNYYYFGLGTYYYNFYTNTVVLADPTNQPARIEVTGDRLNLSNARIRAEGLVSLKTKHLVAGAPAAMDAGNMVIDFASTNGSLVISNVLPSSFSRSRGSVYCWGFNWTNATVDAFGTNQFKFHVLVVDHAIQAAATPVIRDLALRATNIYAQDTLYVNQSALFEGENLAFNGPVSLVENAQTFNDAVAPNLKNFLIETNGVLFAANQLSLGSEMGNGLVSWTNRGQAVAQVIRVETSLMENSGSLHTSNSLFLTVTTNQFLSSKNSVRNPDAGSLILTTNPNPLVVVLPGTQITNQLPVPSKMFSEWDTEISARVLRANYSVISNGMTGSGILQLDVSDELSDGVPPAPGTNDVMKNFWSVANGFKLLQKPAIGDLYGTEIRTTSDGYKHAKHTWSGEDRGRSVAGFSNNVAIGHLVLDRKSTNCVLEFTGTGARNGLYVDYLDFQDSSYSNYNGGLAISPNLVIYFADSNVDPTKLTNSYPGRLVWVPEFAGPNSSMLVLAHVNGVVTNIYANRALALNKDLDSNGDGTPNFYDTFRFDGTFLRATAGVGGTISPSLDGKSLFIGTNYTMNAVPNRGYLFSSWVITNSTGVVNSMSPSLKFAMESGLAVQATFIPDPSYLQLSVSGAGQVTPDLVSSSLVFGKKYQLTAKPAPGNVFVGWSGDIANSTSPTVSFVMAANMNVHATFTTNELPNVKGVYSGLFYTVDNGVTNAAFESSGALNFTLGQNGIASGKVIMGEGSYSFSAKFGLDGNAQAIVKRTGGLAPLIVTISSADVDGTATGTVTDGTFVSQLQCFRSQYNAGTNPAGAAGYYTFAWPGLTDNSGPAGDAYGSVTVSKAGVATVSTKLPDGTSFVTSGTLSQDGHLPLFFTRTHKDAVLSMITFDTNDASVATMLTNRFIGMSGKVFWTKKAGSTSPKYKDGFVAQYNMAGSWYKVPAPQATGLVLHNPIIAELNGGNLAVPYYQQVALTPKTLTFVSARSDVSLTIAPQTGFFTGKSVSGDGKTTVLNGVVLQRQDVARGCFYGPSLSGEVLLHNLNEF